METLWSVNKILLVPKHSLGHTDRTKRENNTHSVALGDAGVVFLIQGGVYRNELYYFFDYCRIELPEVAVLMALKIQKDPGSAQVPVR